MRSAPKESSLLGRGEGRGDVMLAFGDELRVNAQLCHHPKV